MTDPPTMRDVYLAQAKAQLDLVLNLAGQVQARAQVVAGTSTLIVTVLGVIASANTEIFKRIEDDHLEGWGWTAVAALVLSLGLSLWAAAPASLDLPKPVYLRNILADPASNETIPLDLCDQLDAINAKFDRNLVDLLEGLQSQTSLRGWLTLWAAVATAAGAAILLVLGVVVR